MKKAWFIPLLLLALACGDDDGGGTDAAQEMATARDEAVSEDMETGDAPAPDLAADAAPDAEADAAPDAEMDATADAEIDAAVDAEMDATMDAMADGARGAPCLTNFECEDDEACTIFGDEGSFCAVGERGDGAYGEACTTSEECASGACIDDMFCTQECRDDDDCPSDNLPRCSALGLCVRPR
ncbi:MAG: hypothetical protein AAF645_12395 [Myxococcota bacterium]